MTNGIASSRATRRELLIGAACCAAAAASPSTFAARSDRASLESERLAPNVLWIRGAGANLLAIRDDRGLAFIDGGFVDHAPAVLRLAEKELGIRGAHTVVNTHWHPQHVGLNAMIGKAGGRIVAHENTRLWLSTPVEQQLDAKPVPPLPPQARPNETTYADGEFAAGEETVRYGYLSQAHTDGDLYVHLKKANVLVTGGVVAGRGWSTVDYVTGGWINGMVAGYQRLVQLCDEETRIVTSLGDKPLTRKALDDERAMLAKLSEQLGKMLRSGFGPADVLAAAPAKEFEARYGDATEFLTQSFKSLWGHVAPDA